MVSAKSLTARKSQSTTNGQNEQYIIAENSPPEGNVMDAN